MRYSKSAAMYWWIIVLSGVVGLFLLVMLSILAFDALFNPNFEAPESVGKIVAVSGGFVGVSLYVGRWALVQAKKPAPKFD
jgi:nitric oxide reductase large subunit